MEKETITQDQWTKMLRETFSTNSRSVVAVTTRAGVDPELGRYIEHLDAEGKRVGIVFEDIGKTNMILGKTL